MYPTASNAVGVVGPRPMTPTSSISRAGVEPPGPSDEGRSRCRAGCGVGAGRCFEHRSVRRKQLARAFRRGQEYARPGLQLDDQGLRRRRGQPGRRIRAVLQAFRMRFDVSGREGPRVQALLCRDALVEPGRRTTRALLARGRIWRRSCRSARHLCLPHKPPHGCDLRARRRLVGQRGSHRWRRLDHRAIVGPAPAGAGWVRSVPGRAVHSRIGLRADRGVQHDLCRRGDGGTRSRPARGAPYASDGCSCTATAEGPGSAWSSAWGGTYYAYSCADGSEQVAFNWGTDYTYQG